MERVVQLSPAGQRGGLFEEEVELKRDETLEYGFSIEPATPRVEFNIHSHHGEEVEYVARSYEPKKSGTFRCVTEGKYYLMWKNDGSEPVTLRFWFRVASKK